MSKSLISVLVFSILASAAVAQPAPADNKPDATLGSTPNSVVWGYFAADIPPALRIKSGQTVRIDTVSHGGINTADAPVTFFGKTTRVVQAVQMERLRMMDAVEIVRRAHGLAHALGLPRLHIGAEILAEQLQPADHAVAPLDARNLEKAVTEADAGNPGLQDGGANIVDTILRQLP